MLICGAGKKEMEKEIIMLEDQFPDAAKGVAEFSTPLAHQIIAGVLLPDHMPCCILCVLDSWRYGCVHCASLASLCFGVLGIDLSCSLAKMA